MVERSQESCWPTSVFSDVSLGDNVIKEADLPFAFNDFMVSLASDVPSLSSDVLVTLGSELKGSDNAVLITEFEVFLVLSRLRGGKASLTNAISNDLLRSLADVLAAPICAIINSSIRNGCVPHQWKNSRVTLVPKVMPVIRIETDIRPISITCPVAGIAESCVSRFFDGHFDN